LFHFFPGLGQAVENVERKSGLKSMEELALNNGNGQGPMLLNFLRATFTNIHNKLECFSLASLSSLV
jgi:hypothetical protein